MTDPIVSSIAALAFGTALWTLIDRKRHEKRLHDSLHQALREQEGMRKACGLCGESTRDEGARPSSIQKIQVTTVFGSQPRVARVHDACWRAYRGEGDRAQVEVSA